MQLRKKENDTFVEKLNLQKEKDEDRERAFRFSHEHFEIYMFNCSLNFEQAHTQVAFKGYEN